MATVFSRSRKNKSISFQLGRRTFLLGKFHLFLHRLGIGFPFLYKNYKSEIEWKTSDHQGHVMNEAIRAIR